MMCNVGTICDMNMQTRPEYDDAMLCMCVCVCTQGMLGAFVDFIKERKTVPLEDLAAHFGLGVQVCYPGTFKQE